MTCTAVERCDVTLDDEAFDNLIHDWIVCLTGLEPKLVRPAWQPDPPPIPEFTCPCWVAFYITRVFNDWDPVVGSDQVWRCQDIDLTLTFYGRKAGDYALGFRMSAGFRPNNDFLSPHAVLTAMEDQVVVSEMIKGRWQRRVDVFAKLKRSVCYQVDIPQMGNACMSLIADGSPEERSCCVGPDTNFGNRKLPLVTETMKNHDC